MSDKILCKLCSFEALDLRFHIERFHGMSAAQYKLKTGGVIVSESVLKKREETSLQKYGDKHFTNRPAAMLSFQRYENGHPLSDPKIREKAADTMEKLYGDRHFTNREKAKKTSMERYGVEHSCAAPEVIKKRIFTLKERYGRVFNVKEPHNKFHLENENEFRTDFMSGMTKYSMTLKYKISEPTLNRVLSELGLTRSPVIPHGERVTEGPQDIVGQYLRQCIECGEKLTFYEYGKRYGQSKCLKLKRLFNKGKRYNYLKDDLNSILLSPEKHQEFLDKLQ